MLEFLQAILAMPTVLFSAPLALALLYWVLVIAGAADLDVLGGADGLAEGAAEGVAEGLAEGAAEGLAEGAAEASGETALAVILSLLRLRSAPVTVIVSLLSFFGWAISLSLNAWLHALLGGLLPGFAIGGVVFLVALAGSLTATSLCVRPLEPLFRHVSVRGQRHLVGRTCRLRTTRVDAHFGQAEVDDGGAGLLLHVRCAGDNRLKKGDEALIIDYDAARDVYLIEPMRALLERDGAEPVPALTADPQAAET